MARTPRRYEYVECRTYGHSWEEFRPHGKRPPQWGWRLSLRCTRCPMERHDTIDRLGRLSSRHYDAPDGYALTGIAKDDRPKADDWRRRLAAKRRVRVKGM